MEYSVVFAPNSENQFEITASNNDFMQSFLLQADSKENTQQWISILKQAKIRYWHMDIDRLPDSTSRGYLMKSGRNKSKWNRRWFVLTDNFLLYFKTPKVIFYLLLFINYYYYYYYYLVINSYYYSIIYLFIYLLKLILLLFLYFYYLN